MGAPDPFLDQAVRWFPRQDALPAELAMRFECEAKFAVADADGLDAALVDAGFKPHASRHEFDLYLAGERMAEPGRQLKLRYSPELNRLTLIAKCQSVRAGDGPLLSEVAWRDYPANGDVLERLARAGLRGADAVAKHRMIYTHADQSACVDRLIGFGMYLEISVAAQPGRSDAGAMETEVARLSERLKARLKGRVEDSYLNIVRIQRRGTPNHDHH